MRARHCPAMLCKSCHTGDSACMHFNTYTSACNIWLTWKSMQSSHIDTRAGAERQLGIRDGQPEDLQPSVSDHAAAASSSSGQNRPQQSAQDSMPSAAQPSASDHSMSAPSIAPGTTEPASLQQSMPGTAEASAAPHELAQRHHSTIGTTEAAAAVNQPAAQPHSALDTAEAPGAAQQTAEGSARASVAAQQSKAADSTEHEPDAPEGVDPVGLGRPILLFKREAMAGQAESASNVTSNREPDESYYEFTADDYHRSVAALYPRLAAQYRLNIM